MAVARVTEEDELRKLLDTDADSIVIVKFGAIWCGPCTELQPVFESLANDLQNDGYKATLVEIDRDGMEDVFAEYGILAMPTFKTFTRGDVVKDVVKTIQTPSADQLRTEIRASLPSPELLLDVDF